VTLRTFSIRRVSLTNKHATRGYAFRTTYPWVPVVQALKGTHKIPKPFLGHDGQNYPRASEVPHISASQIQNRYFYHFNLLTYWLRLIVSN